MSPIGCAFLTELGILVQVQYWVVWWTMGRLINSGNNFYEESMRTSVCVLCTPFPFSGTLAKSPNQVSLQNLGPHPSFHDLADLPRVMPTDHCDWDYFLSSLQACGLIQPEARKWMVGPFLVFFWILPRALSKREEKLKLGLNGKMRISRKQETWCAVGFHFSCAKHIFSNRSFLK